MLLAALSACQLLGATGSGGQKPQGMDDYDYAVEQFEIALDEVQLIQEGIYRERWLVTRYGNRPEPCTNGSGAEFGILRMTPTLPKSEGRLPSTVSEGHQLLVDAGFTVGQLTPDSGGNTGHFSVVGETGRWDVMLNDQGAWSIYGSTNCIDIDQKNVWDEVNRNGFMYYDYTERALFPHERLPIRRGETPAPSPTPYPASQTYGRPRPTSTQYFPPTTSPVETPTPSRPEQTP